MDERNLVEKAKTIAQKYHKDQKRESGESLYNHLESVLQKMIEAKIEDENVLASALLHHLPRATNDALEIIKNEINSEVAKIVELYHNLSQKELKKETPKKFNEHYIIQTYINLAKDMRVLVLALANQCDNIETAFALPSDKKQEVAEKTLFLYAPISKMLGTSVFTKTLEDESFKILNPSTYAKIQRAVQEKSEQIQKFFEEAIPILSEFLKEKGIEATIQHRIKNLYSIYRKSERYKAKGIEVGQNLEPIYDIGAMRIITNTLEEVYMIEDILKSLWDQIPHLRDDYIQKPRPTGYRSLHNTFTVEKGLNIEIQIRTWEMHEEAEYGVCSHLFYKIGEKFKNELEKNPNWVKDLNYYQAYDKATIKHFGDNVYAFTPKGDIIELPRGSTVLDFAYHVHTQIGNSCAGAKINGKIAKLDTIVKDGDVVEILLDRSRRKPSKDWLNIVKTKKAYWEVLKGLKQSISK